MIAADSDKQTLSERARSLLTGREGYDVEFKESLGQVKASDIVAFANSPAGGTILVGVREEKDERGHQMGDILGCPVGDKERQSIISRAESCLPPVRIEMHTEANGDHEFYRVEVPSSEHKPHCTGGGTYKIRGDGRSKPLPPSKLLYIFIEAEGEEFVERFRNATEELESSLLATRSRLVKEMGSLLSTVEGMEREVVGHLGQIFKAAEDAKALSDEAMALSDMSAGGVEQVLVTLERLESRDLDWIREKVDALLAHFAIEDPRRRKAREYVESETERLYEQGLAKEEIADKLRQQWEAGFIGGAGNEIRQWRRKKIHELEDEEDRE